MPIILSELPPRYGSAGKQPERLGNAGGIAAFTMPALRAEGARTAQFAPFYDAGVLKLERMEIVFWVACLRGA